MSKITLIFYHQNVAFKIIYMKIICSVVLHLTGKASNTAKLQKLICTGPSSFGNSLGLEFLRIKIIELLSNFIRSKIDLLPQEFIL